MILLLKTATPVCEVTIIKDNQSSDYEWQADRQLAKGLLGHLERVLGESGAGFGDITGIGVYKGPGSFTGLRIGLTVMNTLADAASIPIVGVTGDDWQKQAVERLQAYENDKIVLPDYGAEAHITQPRK